MIKERKVRFLPKTNLGVRGTPDVTLGFQNGTLVSRESYVYS